MKMVRGSLPEEILAANDPKDVEKVLDKSFSTELWLHWAKLVGSEAAFEAAFKATRHDLSKTHLVIHEWLQRYPSKQLFERMATIPHLQSAQTLGLAQKYGLSDWRVSLEAKKFVQAREFHETRLMTPSKSAFRDYLDEELEPDYKIGLYKRALDAVPSEDLWLELIEYVWSSKSASDALVLARRAPLTDAVAAVCVLLGDSPDFSGCQTAAAKLCVSLDALMQDAVTAEDFFQTVTWALKQSSDPKWMLRVLTLAKLVDQDEAEKLWVQSPSHFECYSTWLRTVDLEYFKKVLSLKLTSELPLLEDQYWVFAMTGRRLDMQQTRAKIRRLESRPQVALAEDTAGRSRETNSIICSGESSEILAALGSIVPRNISTSEHRTVVELGCEAEKMRALAFLKYKGLDAYDAVNTTVWLTGYPVGCDLAELASCYGQVLAIRTPQTSGRRFAYIQYSISQEALNAVEGIQPPLVARLSDPRMRQDRSGAVEEERQLHVSGFDFSSNPAQVEAWVRHNSLFQPESVAVPPSDAHANPGYAFVVYSSALMANQCLGHYNTLEHAGRKIRAVLSKKKRRHPNVHTLKVSNVEDPAALQELVGGDVKYTHDTKTALVLFSSEQQVATASLKLAGRSLGGLTLKVEQPFRPRKRAR